MADVIGRTLGNYKIQELIARGGMATVYKAYQVSLDRYVALKILPESFAYDPTLYDRFEQEAKAAARLRHPSITQVIDFGKDGDMVYLVMEYIGGGTLQQRLKQPIALDDALEITRQVADALGYAHSHGLIHRDVKPSNILFTNEGHAVLSDFGIAKVVERSVALTRTGVGVGTPEYMSPEQAQGLVVDGRSDIYSLGVVLFEMATGRVPYESDTPLGVVLKHLNDPLPLPRSINPAIPAAVENVIMTCLAKSPDKRYENAGALMAALDDCMASRPTASSFPTVDGQATLVGPITDMPAASPRRPTPKPKTPLPQQPPAEAKPKTPPPQQPPVQAKPMTPPPAGAKPMTPPPQQPPVQAKPKTSLPLPANSAPRPMTPPQEASPARLQTPLNQPVWDTAAQSASPSQPGAEPAPFSPALRRASPSILSGQSGMLVGGVALLVVVVLLAAIAVIASGARGKAAASPTGTATAVVAVRATSTVLPAVPAPAATAVPTATAAATATTAPAATTAASSAPAAAATATAAPTATPVIAAAATPTPMPAASATTQAAAPAPNAIFKGRIVFTNFRGPDKYGDYDILVLDLPGTVAHLITQYGSSPTFSPDGTRILYFSWTESGFYTMTPDGKNQVTVSGSSDDAFPTWSPDGKRIAFTNKGAVWVMNADGGGRTQVINKGDQPAWSADGKQLVFVGCVAADCGLVISDADGKNQHLLTKDASAESPSWAPSADLILYTSNSTGHGSVRAIMPDGSMGVDLTANLKTAAGQPANSGAATWSPDGKTIIFRSDSQGWGIYVMNSDGTGVNKVAIANVTDAWYSERVSVTK